MDPIHTTKRLGYQTILYPNRLVISEKPGIFPAKETILLVKTIAGIDVARMNQELTIKTNDGRSTRIKVYGKEALALRDALLALL